MEPQPASYSVVHSSIQCQNYAPSLLSTPQRSQIPQPPRQRLFVFKCILPPINPLHHDIPATLTHLPLQDLPSTKAAASTRRRRALPGPAVSTASERASASKSTLSLSGRNILPVRSWPSNNPFHSLALLRSPHLFPQTHQTDSHAS